MNRVKRMQPAADVAENRQKNAARLMGERQQQLALRLQRLGELQGYRDEYAAQFAVTPEVMTGLHIREYRLFLDRLNQAVEEQQHHVQQARELLEKSRKDWTRCRTHSDAIHKVIERLIAEEQGVQIRREQAENDEFGQRSRMPKF